MSNALDLDAIKARLAATTPGDWIWRDELTEIPYSGDELWLHGEDDPIGIGNDGSLGIAGLFYEVRISEDEGEFHPVFHADDEDIPEAPDDPEDVDWDKWRGLIRAENLADLEFIASAKSDVTALIAEVERLRQQLRME